MRGASEMTQQIGVLGTKLDDQGSIPGTHMVDLKRTISSKQSSDPLHMHTRVHKCK